MLCLFVCFRFVLFYCVGVLMAPMSVNFLHTDPTDARKEAKRDVDSTGIGVTTDWLPP